MNLEAVNITDEFVDSIYNIQYKDFDEVDLVQFKRCLLDYLASAFVGSNLLREKVIRYLNELNPEKSDNFPIGMLSSTSIENAVFINGLCSHAAELDDGSRYGMIHLGSPIFSALLPAAKMHNVSFELFSTGAIVGYECAIRIAKSIAPSHYDLGYHPTATCGSIGAAVALAKMLNYTRKEFKDTISASCVSAGGSLKVIEDESQLKPYNVANAALNALYASRIGKTGFGGPNDVFSGTAGFFNLMSKDHIPETLLRNCNDEFFIHTVYFKPYAACRHAHAPIEAALSIMKDNRFKTKDIKAVKVYSYKSLIGKHDSKNIYGFSSAKMSIPYSVAVALCLGDVSLERFEDKWTCNDQILSLVKRIDVVADDHYTALVPEKRCARVEVELFNMQVLSKLVEHPKGEPENPLSDVELEYKFKELSSYAGLSSHKANAIIHSVWNLENDMKQLYTHF